jgi:hypothetical protein
LNYNFRLKRSYKRTDTAAGVPEKLVKYKGVCEVHKGKTFQKFVSLFLKAPEYILTI